MSAENIILWPDGEWCYRDSIQEYDWKSDDYEEIIYGTKRYWEFYNSQESDEDFEQWHVSRTYDEDGNIIEIEYLYDENGERIPLSECICAAREPSECGCSCNSWKPEEYYSDDVKTYIGRWQ